MQERPLPTLTDVARRAGVSLATASRALGASRDRVSEELALRVLDAARALDYVPNAHAKALARASSTTIGLVVHDVSDPYFSEIARGVLRVASERDHLVLICNSYRDPERELAYVAELRAQRVHSILMAGSGYTDQAAEEQLASELLAFRWAGGRVALVGRHHVALDAVVPDNVGGAAEAARHLAAQGHRNIAVVTGPRTLTTIEDRLSGFRTGLAECGVELPASRVRQVDFTRRGGYQGTIDLLASGRQPTAIFALNDAMAVGVLAALRERSLAVPADVSVVGFDDIPLAADVTPSLTTVRIAMDEMGARAADLALSADAPGEGATSSDPQILPAPTRLVVRDSTASAPAHTT